MKKWRRFEIRSSTFWKSVYKCGAGTQWRTGTVSGSVKTHPHDCFCSKRFVSIAPPIKSEQDPGVRDGHRVGRYGIKRGARMASDKYCAPPPLPLHNLAPVLSLNIREISNSEVIFFNVSGNTCDVARTWSVQEHVHKIYVALALTTWKRDSYLNTPQATPLNLQSYFWHVLGSM